MIDPKRLPSSELYVATIPAGVRGSQMREIAAELKEMWAKVATDKRLIVVGGGMTIEPLSHLDAAWAEAMSALPLGWRLSLDWDGMTYGAEATDGLSSSTGAGDTPAEALGYLTQTLRGHAATA